MSTEVLSLIVIRINIIIEKADDFGYFKEYYNNGNMFKHTSLSYYYYDGQHFSLACEDDIKDDFGNLDYIYMEINEEGKIYRYDNEYWFEVFNDNPDFIKICDRLSKFKDVINARLEGRSVEEFFKKI